MISKNLLKELLELQTKKGRKLKDKFLLEGARLCQEAIESDWKVEQIFYSLSFQESEAGRKILNLARPKKISMLLVQEKAINKIAETETPQGIVALVQKRNFSLKDVLAKSPAIILALDNIKDPGNLGTMLRTADAAGVGTVLLSQGSVELYNSKVVRTTMGSIFHLNPVNNLNFSLVIPELKNLGYRIAATSPQSGRRIDHLDFSGKICLLIGNEAFGLSEEILKLSDLKITLPIFGKAESLNAAVACGIILYQIALQKNKEKNF
jgi:TrmH family RNA methyltransferase